MFILPFICLTFVCEGECWYRLIKIAYQFQCNCMTKYLHNCDTFGPILLSGSLSVSSCVCLSVCLFVSVLSTLQTIERKIGNFGDWILWHKIGSFDYSDEHNYIYIYIYALIRTLTGKKKFKNFSRCVMLID